MRPSRAQGRPPPPNDPAVESWLDGLPPSTTKPTPEELRQWDLDDRGASGRSAFVTGIVVRSLSLVAAILVTILITASLILSVARSSVISADRLVPAIVVCSVITLWDTAEFITMCALGGRGIPPKVHVWVDGVLFAGAAAATGILVLDTVMDLLAGWRVYDKTKELICSTLLVVLMLLHSFLFFFYFCAHLGRQKHKTATPRVMYLPTGQPVIVTSRPVAHQTVIIPGQVELAPLQTSQPVVPPPPPAVPTASPTSPTAVANESINEAFRQGVPPRKPVAGVLVGTHYAMPWPGPEYRPDAAEQARASRGEKQAQWMTLHGMRRERETLSGGSLDPNKTRTEEIDRNASAGKAKIPQS